MHLSLSTQLNPGANLIHWREPDATDLIFCDMPAFDGGKPMNHIFAGLVSCVTNGFKANTFQSKESN